MLDLLDSETEDIDDELDEVFFPGSDDELGFVEEEVEHDRSVKLSYYMNKIPYHFTVCITVMTTVMMKTIIGKGACT